MRFTQKHDVIGLGTVAVGVFAVGSVTMGLKAYAWLSALGWTTAQSGESQSVGEASTTGCEVSALGRRWEIANTKPKNRRRTSLGSRSA